MRSIVLSFIVLLIGASSLFAQVPTTKPSVSLVPDEKVDPQEIGLTRKTVRVSVPPGHKLMVLTRVYHEEKLDQASYFDEYPAQEKWRLDTFPITMSVFDPSVLMPERTDTLKVAAPGFGPKGFFPGWITVKNMSTRQMISMDAKPLTIGKTHVAIKWRVGGMSKHADGEYTDDPPEWRVTVLVRIEPMTDKELAHPYAGIPSTVARDASKFPYVEGEDADPERPKVRP
ncbi:MAG TPA: hypothetical protein VK968_10420 [Roseimicrobium sp.]|nr:hypothetical protein [Roseimicrobium sp.]